MPASIFVLNGDSQLTQVRPSEFDYERVFQELIAKNSELLLGDLINPDKPRRWILVKREMGIPAQEEGGNRWSLDHLFLDQEGIPTLVEVKLVGDPRARREVVAQMLDYAANAVLNWTVENVRNCFEQQCRGIDADPAEALSGLLQGETTEMEFWEMVKINLGAQKIRLVFVADRIADELKTIVKFLNRQMSPAEVLAVELQYFTDTQGTLRTLVPTLYGESAASKSKRTSASTPGVEIADEEFFEVIRNQNNQGRLESIRKVYSWAGQNNLPMSFRRGDREFSFSPIFVINNKSIYAFTCKHDGKLVFRMKVLSRSFPPFDLQETRDELEAMLTKIPGFVMRDGGMTGLPYIAMDKLETDRERESVLQVLSWIYDKLQPGSAS